MKLKNPVRAVKQKVMTNDIVLKQTKKSGNIVYGARAIQANIGRLSSRPTSDWDIFSSNPKKSAKQLTNKLNKVGFGNYYKQSEHHKSTWKVNNIGPDQRRGTKDDIGIADYTKPTSKQPYKVINGVKYVKLSSTIKDKKKSLRDKEFAFRHKKDLDDLNRIKKYNKMKKDKLLRNFLFK